MAFNSFAEWWDKKAQENNKKQLENMQEKISNLEAFTTTTSWPVSEKSITDAWLTVTLKESVLCICGHNDYNHSHRTDNCYFEDLIYTEGLEAYYKDPSKLKISQCKCKSFRAKPKYREIPKGLI
jgi:hypothetical protein